MTGWLPQLTADHLVLLVAAYCGVAVLWLAWRWDRPLTTPRKRKPRRS